MQKHICIVSFADGKQQVVDRSSVSKNNTIEESEWVEDWNYEDGGYHHSKHIPVEIDNEYVLIVLADFILVEGKDIAAFTSRTNRGMCAVNGLMYAYSVTIIEKLSKHQLFEDMVVYTESGVKTTKYNMYSYHNNDPFRYNTYGLFGEVLESIDLDIILIKSYVSKIK